MLDRVSFHAVIRWLERVEGFNTASCLKVAKDENPQVQALFCCMMAGCDMETVQRAILTPCTRAALAMHARGSQRITKVLGSSYTIIIRNGIVATVTTKDMNRKALKADKRLNVQTVRQGKRAAQRMNRRLRGAKLYA